jgi:hypothetical protein
MVCTAEWDCNHRRMLRVKYTAEWDRTHRQMLTLCAQSSETDTQYDVSCGVQSSITLIHKQVLIKWLSCIELSRNSSSEREKQLLRRCNTQAFQNGAFSHLFKTGSFQVMPVRWFLRRVAVQLSVIQRRWIKVWWQQENFLCTKEVASFHIFLCWLYSTTSWQTSKHGPVNFDFYINISACRINFFLRVCQLLSAICEPLYDTP